MHLRLGSTDDSKWIVESLIEGADDGHFGPSMKFQAKEFLHAIIENGGVHMMKLRGGIHAPAFVQMELTVAELDGVPASFLICCKENDSVEIQLAGTLKEFRRNGCFNRLVKRVIENDSKSRIYARCYKQSSWAIKAFEKLHFKITKHGDPIELTLSK